MQRIHSIFPDQATGSTKNLLDSVRAEEGYIPNMLKVLANSAASLEGFLQFSEALSNGKLDRGLREQIALTIAQLHRGEYCIAQHAARAGRAGLTHEEIEANRHGRASEEKTELVLGFARNLAVGNSGGYPLEQLHDAGYTDADLIEIIANVAINLFENMLNDVAQTDSDFPKIERLKVRAA